MRRTVNYMMSYLEILLANWCLIKKNVYTDKSICNSALLRKFSFFSQELSIFVVSKNTRISSWPTAAILMRAQMLRYNSLLSRPWSPNLIKILWLSPNVSTSPLWQCLPFSCTTLRGKHCWHPIAVMVVVDTFGHWSVVLPRSPNLIEIIQQRVVFNLPAR